jgi:hypothetical protein
MTSVYDLNSLAAVVQFAGWTLVVIAATAAIFRSFPAQELKARRLRAANETATEVNKALFEARTGLKWNAALARGDEMAAKVPLSDAELADRRKRVNIEFDRTVWRRALSYFLECPMCQSFWTALTVFLLTTPTTDWWPDLIPTALAYTTASAILLALPGAMAETRQRPAARDPRRGGGCGG